MADDFKAVRPGSDSINPIPDSINPIPSTERFGKNSSSSSYAFDGELVLGVGLEVVKHDVIVGGVSLLNLYLNRMRVVLNSIEDF